MLQKHREDLIFGGNLIAIMLTHLVPLVSFSAPWKYQQARVLKNSFMMFSVDIEKHRVMDWVNSVKFGSHLPKKFY